jgi:hypothetical protein
VVELLKEKLEDGSAEIVSKAFSDSLKIMVNDEVLELYSVSPEFAKFVTEYLEGKPRWL